MFIPETFMWLMSGFACYGVLCLIEEIIYWASNRNNNTMPVRLVLLFQNNAETVEWFVRRLHRVLRMESNLQIAEVLLVDVDSHDNTPAILAKLSQNHHLFNAISIDKESALNNAGNSLVVDCRSADWVKCFRRVKALVGADGSLMGGHGALPGNGKT